MITVYLRIAVCACVSLFVTLHKDHMPCVFTQKSLLGGMYKFYGASYFHLLFSINYTIEQQLCTLC